MTALSYRHRTCDSVGDIDLLTGRTGGLMTKGRWLLLGAVVVGLAVGLYLLFFCPTECQ